MSLLRATEKIYDNLYGAEMRYGKIDIPITHTFSCFFVTECTFDKEYIRSQVMDLLLADCSEFHLYGEYSSLWKEIAELVYSDIFGTDDCVRVIEYEYECNIAEMIFRASLVRAFIPSLSFLIYDDVLVYKNILSQVEWLKCQSPVFHYINEVLKKMNPYGLFPDAPANELYAEAEQIADQISSDDTVGFIASCISEQLNFVFEDVFSEEECLEYAEMIKERMERGW